MSVITGRSLKLAEGQLLAVDKCQSCDGKHDQVAVAEFTRVTPPFTHWYTCPATNDPVPIALVEMVGGEGMELSGPTIGHFAQAMAAGQWMVAVWFIADGKLELRRSTWRFPQIDYFGTAQNKGCVQMLEEMLRAEIGNPLPAEMKDAIQREPMRNLMGKGGPGPRTEKFKMPNGANGSVGVGEFRNYAGLEPAEATAGPPVEEPEPDEDDPEISPNSVASSH